jgi:AcrR family transcriptional regulator
VPSTLRPSTALNIPALPTPVATTTTRVPAKTTKPVPARSKPVPAKTTRSPRVQAAQERNAAKTPGARPTAQASGEETRARIISAAIEALNTEGITGSSARTIARIGDFNQALIFYHFGSVEGLLVAAAKAEGEVRSERYAERFAEVRALSELVTIARAVHEIEQEAGSVNVLTQMLAGAASSPMLRAGVYEAMTPWLVLVEEAIARVIEGSGLASLVPIGDLAFAVASLFIGLELMTALDESGERAASLFESIEKFAALFSMLLPSPASAIPVKV